VKHNKIVGAILMIAVSPFLFYGTGQFIPYYDGFIVTSGSMEPEIQTGSLLFTTPSSVENIRVGDTITFGEKDSLTTHKVIEKNISGNQTTFKTQGIANNSPDPGTVTENQIIGKKLFSIPYLGYITTWAGTTTGLTILIIIPGTLLMLLEAKKIHEEITKQPQKDENQQKQP
jgi:signal peptidase